MSSSVIEAVRRGLPAEQAALIDAISCASRVGGGAHDARLPEGRPREALLRALDGRLPAFSPASQRLVSARLAGAVRDALDDKRPWEYDVVPALRALAPDTVVPADPVLAALWRVLVGALGDSMPSRVLPLGRPSFIRDDRLATLQAEAREALHAGHRRLGSVTIADVGPTGRKLSVSKTVMNALGNELGYPLSSGYMAAHQFYAGTGDGVAPHIDRGSYEVTLILLLSHRAPLAGRRSALLAYGRDGSVERFELKPGEAVLIERGAVHAREPLGRGEDVTIFVTAFHRDGGASEPRA